MMKNSKKKEQQAGDQPRASKRKIQQSAPLASGVSVPEKAKKPKGVAAETAILLVSSPPAEVGKKTSASNVAEEERKMPALPKYAAVPRKVFEAGAVPVECHLS
jgi:Mrp family chromosome partitioning ATPase